MKNAYCLEWVQPNGEHQQAIKYTPVSLAKKLEALTKKGIKVGVRSVQVV